MNAVHNILARLHSHKTLVWRCFWSLVLLLHAPITLKVFGGGVFRGSSLILALANAFFIWEIYRPTCLKLITDRRSAVVFLLIVALLHTGVLEHGFPVLANTWGHGSVLIFTIAVTASTAAYIALRYGKFLSNCGNFRSRNLYRHYAARYVPVLILVPQARSRPYAGRRGPPLR